MFVLTEEMTTQRELAAASENSLAAFLSNVLPDSIEDSNDKQNEPEQPNGNGNHDPANNHLPFSLPDHSNVSNRVQGVF